MPAWTNATSTAAGVPRPEEPGRHAGVELADRGWGKEIVVIPPDAARERDYATLLAFVTTMPGGRSVVRVGDLEQPIALSTRPVQRLLAREVGTGPTRVLARYRVLDPLEALDAGAEEPRADLATAHGSCDQAHSTRDLTALVEVSPGECRAGR